MTILRWIVEAVLGSIAGAGVSMWKELKADGYKHELGGLKVRREIDEAQRAAAGRAAKIYAAADPDHVDGTLDRL